MKLLGGLAVWVLLCGGSYPLVKSFAYKFKAKDFVQNRVEVEYERQAERIEHQYDGNMIAHQLAKNSQKELQNAEKEYKKQIQIDKQNLRKSIESEYANAKPGSAHVPAIDVEAANLAMMICGGLFMIVAMPVGLIIIFG